MGLLWATGTALVRLISVGQLGGEPAKHPLGLNRVGGSQENRGPTFQLRLSLGIGAAQKCIE